MMLVKILQILKICNFFATLSNCGNSLRALTTTLLPKENKGTRVMTVHNGNNVKDWVIRIEAPTLAKIRVRRTFND